MERLVATAILTSDLGLRLRLDVVALQRQHLFALHACQRLATVHAFAVGGEHGSDGTGQWRTDDFYLPWRHHNLRGQASATARFEAVQRLGRNGL